MTEAQATSLLTAALKKRNALAAVGGDHGWLVVHDVESGKQRRGKPDLRVVWQGPGPCPAPHADFEAELKSEGRRTDEQRRYANAAIARGAVCYEWRVPQDLDQMEAAFALPAGTLSGTPSAPPGDATGARATVEAQEVLAARQQGYVPLPPLDTEGLQPRALAAARAAHTRDEAVHLAQWQRQQGG